MLIEQSIANYLSLQPYEYINTESYTQGCNRYYIDTIVPAVSV